MKKLLYILLFVPFALFGQENYSLSFDGEDDYVEIPNFTFNDSIFSFSANVFFNEDQEWAQIFWIGDQIENVGDTAFSIILGINSHGIDGFPVGPKLYFSLNYGNGEAYSVDYNLNEWNAISGVFNGQQGVIKLYVNGSESVSSTDVSYLSIQNIDSFINTIGAGVTQGQPNSSNFNGQIDNFTVYNRELTTSEILDLNYSCPTHDGLLAFWDFNSPGDSLYDISGNENHGLIYGANTSPPSPFYNCTGCHDVAAINFQQWAVWDNYECIYSFEYLNSLQEEYSSYQDEATTSLSHLQQALDTWNTTIDLSAGWNMFGYGCPNPIDLAEGLSNHTESVVIVKDNNGSVYMPEFSFNGIGDLTPGFGYQIKVSVAIEGFSLCDWYVNDIPEDNIVSLQDENNALLEDNLYLNDSINQLLFELALLSSNIDSCQYLVDYAYGCNDIFACNYSQTALFSIDACEYPASDNLDCDGNELVLEIGDLYAGGVVFYIDESGQHGLVAAIDDLPGFVTYPSVVIVLSNYTYNNFNDWYLPSVSELWLLFNSIGSGGISQYEWGENEFGFTNDYYLTSNIIGSNVLVIGFSGLGSEEELSQEYPYLRVRPIRSF